MPNTNETEFKRVISKGGKIGWYCGHCNLYVEDRVPHYCPCCSLPTTNPGDN